jgi:hypothetical protein
LRCERRNRGVKEFVDVGSDVAVAAGRDPKGFCAEIAPWDLVLLIKSLRRVSDKK